MGRVHAEEAPTQVSLGSDLDRGTAGYRRRGIALGNVGPEQEAIRDGLGVQAGGQFPSRGVAILELQGVLDSIWRSSSEEYKSFVLGLFFSKNLYKHCFLCVNVLSFIKDGKGCLNYIHQDCCCLS